MKSGYFTRFTHWFQRDQRRLEKGQKFYGDRGITTSENKVMTVEQSLGISAVWSCIRLISQLISTLPIEVVDKKTRQRSIHSLNTLFVSSPNADMTMAEFMESVVSMLLLHGNSYSVIKRDKKGNIVSLIPKNAGIVVVDRSETGVVTYIYNENANVAQVYAEHEVLHIKGFTLDGLVGLSPIREGAEFIGLQVAANDAARKGYANSLKAGGVINTGEEILNDEQRDAFREYVASFSRPENTNKFMVLEAGMSVTMGGFSMSHADAQLLESRNFGIEEICRLFGVPPPLIGHTNKASSWASSTEEMNMQFLTYAIRPILVKIEQAISRALLTPAERLSIVPKFDVESLLRADSKTRAQYYRDMSGFLVMNEVRAAEGLPPVKGGDVIIVPLNMTTLEDLSKNEQDI